MGKKRTIGVLIGQIADRYHSQLWPPLVEVAKQNNVSMLLFIGQSLNDPVGFRSQDNIIYTLPGRENVDGLLVFAGTLGNYISDAEMSEFLKAYQGLPIVCVSRKVEGYPCLAIENYDGMYELVKHMIVEHGKKRIAFIRGMPNNPEAEKRYQAYRDALRDHQIPFDETLVATGTFAGPTGADAVADLMDKRKVKFDALVAANDDMLVWARIALKDRNVHVPDDVAIGGFDNLPETQFSDPPITTVEQPSGYLSTRAAEMLIQIMDGQHFDPAEYKIPAQLIVRKSCGCTGKRKRSNTYITPASFENKTDAEVLQIMSDRKNDIYLDLFENQQSISAYQANSVKINAIILLELLLDLIPSAPDPVKADEIIQNIVQQQNKEYPLEFWRALISIIQENIFEYWIQNPNLAARANTVFQRWLNYISHQDLISYNNETNRFANIQWGLLGLTQDLSATFQLEKTKDILSRHLPVFEMNACYICLYEDPSANIVDLRIVPSKKAHLIFAYNRLGSETVDIPRDLFPIQRLIPFDFASDEHINAWGIVPLCFENSHFGYMCFELHPTSNPYGYSYIVHNTIKEHISSSLKGAFLIQELKTTQNQLVQTAKIAMEANFHKTKVLVNMSHELRTPLNSINGIADLLEFGGYEMTREIIAELKNLMKQLEGQSDKADVLAELKTQAGKYLDLLENGGNIKPFFFRYMKDRIAGLDGSRYDAVTRILDTIIDYQEKENDVTFKAYRHIKEAGVYLLGLIDMVLNLSKVETGKMDVFKTKVSIRKLVESSMKDTENYSRSLKKDGAIRLSSRTAEDVPDQCFLDQQKVKEVLLNLLSNAIKYTEKGTVDLSVEREANQIRFSVRDSGMGISEAEKNKIFTEFGRTEDARKIEGTGLGLVFSKRLVEMQGGEIDFESEHGRGSTFWFTIPIVEKM